MTSRHRSLHRLLLAGLWLLLSLPAQAEQAARFADVDVHYVVFNTLFLQPEIARRYQVTRAGNRALLNLSVLDKEGVPQTAQLSAWFTNLLGQRTDLQLREVQDGEAIYYLAEFRYSDQDQLRFYVQVTTGAGQRHSFDFSQRMFREGS